VVLSDISDADRRLAAYGTLAPGRPNHHQLAMLRGTRTTGTVLGRLHPEGWGAALGYPALVLGDGEEVVVDLLHSDDLPDHWARLDAFEGDGYRRVATPVATADGKVMASIYVVADRQVPAPASASAAVIC
jgi:gamma-glutamylcyclotransferase (GGCT)/AIG2-like uncharacterized protein YtfP